MRRQKRRLGAVLAVLLVVSAAGPGCRVPPPNLSPQAKIAWQGTRAIKAIDAIRDIAQDGTKTTPPVFTIELATQVTSWHRSALLIIHDTPNGWQKLVDTSLGELEKKLPAQQKAQLTPYIELARGILREVP